MINFREAEIGDSIVKFLRKGVTYLVLYSHQSEFSFITFAGSLLNVKDKHNLRCYTLKKKEEK